MKKNFIVPLIVLAAILNLTACKKGDNPGAKTDGILYMQTNGITNSSCSERNKSSITVKALSA